MATPTLTPDEIITTSTETGNAIRDALEQIAAGGNFPKIPMPTEEAAAIFALGFVGGALGAKMLKGALGVAAGVGIAYWAYTYLSKPPQVAGARR